MPRTALASFEVLDEVHFLCHNSACSATMEAGCTQVGIASGLTVGPWSFNASSALRLTQVWALAHCCCVSTRHLSSLALRSCSE